MLDQTGVSNLANRLPRAATRYVEPSELIHESSKIIPFFAYNVRKPNDCLWNAVASTDFNHILVLSPPA